MKYLDFNIALKSINPQKQTTRPKVFTNDLDSVMIRVTITDMTETDLLGSSAEMLLYMQDRSFFQNTDVTREGNVFKYLLKENEGNHAGIARLQLPVKTADGKTYAQQKLEFEIESGLETKVATEVMIHDWTSLTREARDYISEFELIVNDAKEQVQANIVETAVEEKFNNLEQEYAEDLTQVKSHLAQNALNPFNYGAVGDAVTDGDTLVSGGGDTLALQNVIDDAIANKYTEFKLPKRKYLITDLLVINQNAKGLVIDGSGSTIVWNNTTKQINPEVNGVVYDRFNGMFSLKGVELGESQIISYAPEIAEGAYYQKYGKFTVADASIFEVDDYVVIYVPYQTQTYADYIPSMNLICKVIKVDATNNIVYTDYYSEFDFSNFTFRSTDVLKKVDVPENITIKNFVLHDVAPFENRDTFGMTEDRKYAVSGIGINLAANVTIENVHGYNNKFPVVMSQYAYNLHVDNLTVNDPAFIGGGEGYGLQIWGSYKTDFNKLSGHGERHIVDFSGSAVGHVRNSVASNSYESSFDCHGMCEHDIVFENCIGGFGIGNGIVEFPELTDRIVIKNCKGKLISNNSSNLIIENSDLQLNEIYSNGDVTFKNTELEFTFNTKFEFRNRDNKNPHGNLTLNNVKIKNGHKVPGTLVMNNIKGFKNVRMRNVDIDFNNKLFLVYFTNIESIEIDGMTRKNTFFLLNTDTAINIDYKFKWVTTILEDGFTLAGFYTSVDRISGLKNANGNIQFENCSLQYNASSGSTIITVADVMSGTGLFENSLINLFFNKYRITTNVQDKIALNHYLISQVKIMSEGNQINSLVKENSLKLSESARLQITDYQFKTATLQNNWSSSAPYTAGYQKSPDGTVRLHGVLITGTSNASGVTLFTLPVGYRPKRQLMIHIATKSSTSTMNLDDEVIIKTTGEVVLQSADAAYGVYLDGISFSTL